MVNGGGSRKFEERSGFGSDLNTRTQNGGKNRSRWGLGRSQIRMNDSGNRSVEIEQNDRTDRLPESIPKNQPVTTDPSIENLSLGIRLKIANLAHRIRNRGEDDADWNPDDFLRCYKLQEQDHEANNALSDDDETELTESLKSKHLRTQRKARAKRQLRQRIISLSMCALSIGACVALYIAVPHMSLLSSPYYYWAALPAAAILLWAVCELFERLLVRALKGLLDMRKQVFRTFVMSLKFKLSAGCWGLALGIVWEYIMKEPTWVSSLCIAIAVVSLLVVIRCNLTGLITYEYSRNVFEKQLRKVYTIQLAMNLFCADGESQRENNRAALLRRSIEKSYDELRTEMLKHTLRLPLRYIRRGGRFVWLYSDEYVVEIGDRRETLEVGPVLWDNVTAGAAERDTLTFQQLQKIIRNKNVSRETWKYLFRDQPFNSKFTKYDFLSAVEHFINDRTRTASNLKSWENMAHVVTHIIDFIFWIGMIYVVAEMFGQDTGSVTVALTSMSLSIAFAFAETLSRMIESAIFVFSTHPYDVGDKVIVEDETLLVLSITLLTTEFKNMDNKHMLYSNYELLRKKIFNLRRDTTSVIEMRFDVDFRTSGEQLKQLRQELIQFVRDNSRAWKPRIEFFVMGSERLNSLDVRIQFEHRKGWQEGLILALARSTVIMKCRDVMNELKIEWKYPPFWDKNSSKQFRQIAAVDESNELELSNSGTMNS